MRHFVTGSIASSLHGIPRATHDADIVAVLRPSSRASPRSVARAQAGRLELDYLRKWSARQGTADLLERLLTEAASTG